MNESTKIIIVLIVVGLLTILAVYRFVTQRRQLAAGKILGRFLPRKAQGEFVFENTFTITTPGQWCRFLLTLKSTGSYSVHYSPKYFLDKITLLTGTPYTLTLLDAHNNIVYTEKRSLGDFVSWLGSRSQTTETRLIEHSGSNHQGTVTLLEFLPKEAGSYRLSLRITDRAKAESSGSSSIWEVLDAELTAIEGVTPLSKTVTYPHNRVRI